MITGNKGEWSEIYALLKIVADKKLFAGDADLNKIENLIFPIIKVLRDESDGTYEYSYEDNLVIIKGNSEIFKVPIVEFQQQAVNLLSILKQKTDTTFSIPEVETFVNSFNCYSIKAKYSQKSDIHVVIHDKQIGTTAKLGFSIKSQIGKAATLFNSSQSSNFIYKITGADFSENEIETINNIDTQSKIGDRVRAILEKGANLQFLETEGEVLNGNLILIDSCLPKILSELIVLFNAKNESNLLKLTELLENNNPMNYNNNRGHKFYAYKIKQLLTSCALGMQSTMVWTGKLDATGGYLVVKEYGEVLCYHIYNRNDFEDYLLNNTRLINPSSTRNKFGKIYKEHNELFFKLNIQIRFLK
ncbi:MAG: HpaII family restriction endonuclease [Prevotellaceae bacterium]|jgi:type II restriction enzyme|nr:HpaII family restriction endonuclease [Prevotellaceae bacterium]